MKNDIAWKLQVKFACNCSKVEDVQHKTKKNAEKERNHHLQAKYTCYHFAIIAMGNLYFYDLMNTLRCNAIPCQTTQTLTEEAQDDDDDDDDLGSPSKRYF